MYLHQRLWRDRIYYWKNIKAIKKKSKYFKTFQPIVWKQEISQYNTVFNKRKIDFCCLLYNIIYFHSTGRMQVDILDWQLLIFLVEHPAVGHVFSFQFLRVRKKHWHLGWNFSSTRGLLGFFDEHCLGQPIPAVVMVQGFKTG